MYEIISILRSGKLEPCPQTKIEEFLEMKPDVLSREGPRILNTHMAEKYIPEIAFQQVQSSGCHSPCMLINVILDISP